MTLRQLLAGALLALALPAVAAAASPKMEFAEFYLVLLLRPPNAPEFPKAELDSLRGR
ncbi:MAG: hypothetical protein ACR2MW_03075 [Chthoniobacterales bacterium]